MNVKWGIMLAAVIAFIVPFCSHSQAIGQWNKTTHDFGNFHESQGNQSCAFVLSNTGDSALVVLRVQPTCGCTVAHFPTQAIMPGESGTIDVTYSPTGRPGPFEKVVWAYTNATPQRTRLVIKGSVIGSPESVKQYFPVSQGNLQFTTLTIANGEVKKGLIATNTTTAYNSGTDTVVIRFDNNTSHITCSAIPDTVAPGHISTMSFFFDGSRTPIWGINDDIITIIGTPLNSSREPIKANANIVTNVVEDFSQLNNKELAEAPTCTIMSDKIIMDNMTEGTIARVALTIKNTGNNNLIVRRVMSLDKALTVKCDKTLVKKSEEAIISIKVNPSKVSGKVLNTQFTVITNDPMNPHISVRVVGTIK